VTKTVDPHTLAMAQRPALPPRETQLKILYYMKVVRELENRIERKLYRQLIVKASRTSPAKSKELVRN